LGPKPGLRRRITHPFPGGLESALQVEERGRARPKHLLSERTASVLDRIRGIHEGLDLGFSDYLRDQNVRDATLQEKLDAIDEAVEVLSAEEGINFALFQALGEKRPSPQVYILDFPSDLRASFYLLLGGYYRPAIASLRNLLEMRLIGVYFGLVDPCKFQDWKKGVLSKQESPFGTKLIGRLFQRAEFQRADKRLGLRGRLERLYEELSGLAHGSGLEKYDLQAETDNVPRFNGPSVDLWLRLMYRTFAELVFCLFVAYGKNAFGGLCPEEIKTVLRHLPEPYRMEIERGLAASASMKGAAESRDFCSYFICCGGASRPPYPKRGGCERSHTSP
jgi:hypothetical protein